MSARMAATCVAIHRSVRTQWEDMVVFVPEGTDPREWDFHVWVGYQFSLFYRTLQYPANRNTQKLQTWILFYLSDIDECQQTPNPCAHQCRNVPGSFRCLCPPGTVLLGDGRSCAGLERGHTFFNGTRVRTRLHPQLVSSLGRPILSRSSGVSRVTRQSCPVGYTNRDGTCVGKFLIHIYLQIWIMFSVFSECYCIIFLHRCGWVFAQEAMSTWMQKHHWQF